jgi:hypothetical protein
MMPRGDDYGDALWVGELRHGGKLVWEGERGFWVR